jgi:Secretion system C-terminal sorting domain
MKQFFLTLTFLSALLTAMAQPTVPALPGACNAAACITNSNIDVCPQASNTVVGSHRNGTYNRGNSGNHLGEGAIWRFRNMATVSGVTVNVEVMVDDISNAVLDDLDDDDAVDQAGNSIANFFAPRIGPDQNLNGTNRRGFVQFTMTFSRNASGSNNNTNADFATPVSLANLNYVHYDIDGNDANNVTTGTAGSWFRETGMAKKVSAANPVVLANFPTDLVAYNYTDPVTTNWTGFAGGICERDGVSRCAQVASSFSYGAPQPSITVRMGYDYNAGGNIGKPIRQYGSRLGCFNFPSQSTLPVKLLSFNAVYRNQQAQLKWTTDNEVNFDKYIVERSSNGRDFIPVGEKMNGGTGTVNTYELNDDLSSVSGVAFYYRLKMLDKDTRFTYSSVVLIRKEEKAITGIALSPNPVVNGMATVRFSSTRTASLEFRVVDISGRVVLQQQNKVYEGNNSITMNRLDQLQPGMYVLQMLNDGEVSQTKFSVTR